MRKRTFDINNYSIIEKKTADFFDTHTNTWYEYIPRTYTGEEEVPLVITLHGTGLDGRSMLDFSGWHFVAEQEGFIVVSPDANRNFYWDYSLEGEDITYLTKLISHLCQCYNIDESRIYMQGLSNGDAMSFAFAIKRGDLLAGLGSSIGPTHSGFIRDNNGQLITPVASLPVYQWRGGEDHLVLLPPDGTRGEDRVERGKMNDFNKEYWMKRNKTHLIPEIRIIGEDNTEIYRGGEADVIYHEVKSAPHRSDIYASYQMWRELFSGFARDKSSNSNRLVRLEPVTKAKKDDHAIAVVEGLDSVLIDNEIVNTDDSICPMTVNDVLYVPVSYLNLFFNTTIQQKNSNRLVLQGQNETIELSINEREVLLNSETVLLENKIIIHEDSVKVPLQCVAENIFNKFTSFNDGAMYIADHLNDISDGIVRTLRKILK